MAQSSGPTLSIAIFLLLAIANAQSPAQGPSVAMAPSAALGESVPVVNIPARIELPKLPVLENRFTLTMAAARISVSVTIPLLCNMHLSTRVLRQVGLQLMCMLTGAWRQYFGCRPIRFVHWKSVQ